MDAVLGVFALVCAFAKNTNVPLNCGG